MKIKNFEFIGFFFSKEDLDGSNKTREIGFRYSTGEKNFTDVYLYPKMKMKKTDWSV